jgi:hypothetical protein
MTVKKGCMVVRTGGCAAVSQRRVNHSFNQLLHSTRVEDQVVRLREQAW